MKKILLVLAVLVLIGTVSAAAYNAPIGGTNSITVGYGRTFTLMATGGVGPYTFYSSSCATAQGGSGTSANYLAVDNDASCTIWVEDGYYDYAQVFTDITCVCNHCTTDTDGAMSTNNTNVTVDETAYDDDGMGPDDEASC